MSAAVFTFAPRQLNHTNCIIFIMSLYHHDCLLAAHYETRKEEIGELSLELDGHGYTVQAQQHQQQQDDKAKFS